MVLTLHKLTSERRVFLGRQLAVLARCNASADTKISGMAFNAIADHIFVALRDDLDLSKKDTAHARGLFFGAWSGESGCAGVDLMLSIVDQVAEEAAHRTLELLSDHDAHTGV